ncbi:copper chaperone PCu(A)C [Kiloniella antarctica]|uniref:Copper chaperone PCu(A)C n=1 Tax=Kiloniella antarctica TaxID=1550907 RepID=A0ABW5BDY6_9PROT
MKKLFTALAAIICLSLTSLASADDKKAGDITVQKPWARATLGQMKNGASFLSLHNMGSEDDTLISATGDAAKRIELHSHTMIDGVMKMRQVEGGIPVKAGTMVELKPGSFHIMMMGLSTPLKEGEMFPLTLTFEKSGSVDIMVHVQKGGAMKPMAGESKDGAKTDHTAH